jgi:Kef-type K+ transport system membrane component KefB
MPEASSYAYILSACLLVILSYLFNLLSKKTGIPSVLMLLLTGISLRELLIYFNVSANISSNTVELFGILGLIMIVLEAGLDLQLDRKKMGLIRNAFLSALLIFILSATACSIFLYYYLKEAYLHCLIYAIPLSIVSGAIVIPSISHLQETKREFLIYETSFSDILGIMLFNYIIGGNILKAGNLALFFGSTLFSILLSVILSILILFILTRITTKIRFFLVFAILMFLYAGGKMLHLPSLFIILLFGLLVSNWHLSVFQPIYGWVKPERVRDVVHLLHAITAESSFLIRTFFFVIFGFTIDVRLLIDTEVVFAGTALLLLLFIIRYIYLRFFLHSHIFPELFFMPRGLITVLLFYSIPEAYKLSKFNEGILFFVILSSATIMMIGTIGHRKRETQVIDDEIPIMDSGG